jgi:hypothetical protein
LTLEIRAAEIRTWTKPGRPVNVERVAEYARVAATWELYRLKVHAGPLAADAERFVTLTTALRDLVCDLALPRVCTIDSPGDGVPGITDRNGFLIGDPARIMSVPWAYATAVAHDLH